MPVELAPGSSDLIWVRLNDESILPTLKDLRVGGNKKNLIDKLLEKEEEDMENQVDLQHVIVIYVYIYIYMSKRPHSSSVDAYIYCIVCGYMYI